MIDFHNHIIPNFDDGSKSLKMSISMLKEAYNQGITDVVNTVHYQHPKLDDVNITNEIALKKLNDLQKQLYELSIDIKLHSASEVFYLPNLLEIKNDPIVTIGNGNYMLIEFQPFNIPADHRKIFFDLKMDGITPIIAHPERYKPVQKNINIIYDWLNAGCLIQMDAGSLIGSLGKTAAITAKKIIKNDWCQIIGSDAHNDNNRNFCLKRAYQIAKSYIGKKADLLVKDYPKLILEGKTINVDFEDHRIKKRNRFWIRKF